MEILKFNPIFKPTLWGSETWVVSAVKGSESIVLNGKEKGLTLPEVVERYGADFLGKRFQERRMELARTLPCARLYDG